MSADSNIIEVSPFSRREERDVPMLAANATPMHMLALAVQRGMDAATLKDLMDLQQRWEKAEAEKAYNEAFAAFRAEAISVFKNKTVTDGPLKNKSYAELFSVVDAVTPALSKHGLSHGWKLTKDEPAWIEVTCTLKHIKGHSESVSMGGPPDIGGAKNAIQARVSTVSYLERHTLKAVCGVAEKGEDTNGGGGKALPETEIAAWVKKIEAATTKTAAKDACAEAIQAADTFNDLTAYKTFKETLKAQNEFIDKAAK